MTGPQPWFGTRAGFGALALITIALGLLLQRSAALLPEALRDVLGDALWAMTIAWLAGAIVPEVARAKRAVAALAICWAVEVSQLFHAPWLDAWRATTIGRLTLGTDFDPRDLAAYALGVVGALMLEPALFRAISPAGSRSH